MPIGMRVKQREALCTPFVLPPPAAKEKNGSLWGHPKPRKAAKPPGPPLSAHAYGHPLWHWRLFSDLSDYADDPHAVLLPAQSNCPTIHDKAYHWPPTT